MAPVDEVSDFGFTGCQTGGDRLLRFPIDEFTKLNALPYNQRW